MLRRALLLALLPALVPSLAPATEKARPTLEVDDPTPPEKEQPKKKARTQRKARKRKPLIVLPATDVAGDEPSMAPAPDNPGQAPDGHLDRSDFTPRHCPDVK